MSIISKLWHACLPPQRTFFLFHLVHLQIFAARALGCSDSAFLAAVGFLKMTRLFEKADQLLAMSRGNVITGLTFFRHSSGVSGSVLKFWEV
jgi:hypothetical protein